MNPFWLTADELALYDAVGDRDRQTGFLSMSAWMIVTRPSITDPGWMSVLDNKWDFAARIRESGVPTPGTLGLLHPIGGRSAQGRRLRDATDLEDWARHEGSDGFVLKPVDGMGSRGVVLVHGVHMDGSRVRFLVGEGERTADELLELQRRAWRTQGSILEERCLPDPAVLRLGFTPADTVRVLTGIDALGAPEIISARLFGARSAVLEDRWTNGGLSVGIDLETGCFGQARTRPHAEPGSFGVHPDSGVRFEGEPLPGWEAMARMARLAAEAFAMHPFVVWEFLPSERGPVLIEGNRNFGVQVMQAGGDGFLRGPFRQILDRLGADVPDGSRGWAVRHSRPMRVLKGLRAR